MATVGRCPEGSLELYKRLTCQPLTTDQAVWAVSALVTHHMKRRPRYHRKLPGRNRSPRGGHTPPYWRYPRLVRTNPFSPGAVRLPPYLVGRASQWALIEGLANQIETEGHHSPLCFLAPAGLGKTTLLKQVGRELTQRNWLCGYAEASQDAALAIQDLLADARQALPPEAIGARFRARLQEFNVTAGPVGAGFKLGSLNDGTAYTQLRELLTSLGELAKLDQVGVALLIDEAQVLPSNALDLLFRVVNRLDDFPIAAIMGGLPNIPNVIGNGLRSAPYVFYADLDPLSSEDARAALAEPIAAAGGQCEPSALAHLVKFAEGHPLTLQMVGSSAWIAADRETSPEEVPFIQERHAAVAIDAAQSQLTLAAYRPVWARCKKPERRLLLALANSMGGVQSESDLLSNLKAAMTNPEKVLDNLVGKGVVYAREEAVRFVVPGFDEFVRGRSLESHA